MKKHLVTFLIFAGFLFASCDSVFNNSPKDSETGTISFCIQSKREAVTKENQDSTYQIIVKLSGDYSDEKKVELTSGKSCSVDFGKINVGTKIVAEVEISQNEKLIYKGKSEEYTVKAGENKVTVVLEKLEITINGSIIFPFSYYGNLNIQIDEEKTPAHLYRNSLDVVLKATDINGNKINDRINWNVSLNYQGKEINTQQTTLYEFDVETSTLKLTADSETGYSNYLGIGGIYQINAVATYNDSKSSANFYISVEDKFVFDIYPETQVEHDDQADEDYNVLKKEPVLELIDYITDNKCKNIDFRFHGSFDEETVDIISEAIKLVQNELILQEDILVLKYELDLSDLEGFTQVPDSCFAIYIEDEEGYSENHDNKFLTKVVLPETVTSLGEEAFYDCVKLESVNIPQGITAISVGCFNGCNSLTSINIPDSVNEIGDSAFRACTKLTSIEIPDGVERIEEYTFENCTALSSIVIPETVTYIGDYSFNGCMNIEEINIPDLLTELGEAAFMDCRSLRAIDIPQGVTEINDYCFSGCYLLEECSLPSSIERIGIEAFRNCRALTEINLSEKLNVIEYDCFIRCYSLESITIPASVREIRTNAFEYCKNLSSVTFAEGSILTKISGYAFADTDSLTTITLPKTVKVIEHYAFSDLVPNLVEGNELQAFSCNSFGSIKGLEGTWKYAGSSNYNNWTEYCKYINGEEVSEGYDPSTLTGTSFNYSAGNEAIYVGYSNRYYFRTE